MINILVLGATGNVGIEVIRYLYESGTSNHIIAGVRNIEKAKNLLRAFPRLDYRRFDFEETDTFKAALEGIDRVFLLRPPHISRIEMYFRPLISAIHEQGIREVVFLSVQGAERSKIIPHRKIEQLIIEYSLDYVFLRPSYFMQNLTTTLSFDIKTKRQIILPAGRAKFNWVDVENVGEAAALLLEKFEVYKKQAIVLSGPENLSFNQATELINSLIDHPLKYRNVNPITFYSIKKREGMARGMIIVMILLHFLPGFQQEPAISDAYTTLTGKAPNDLRAFISRVKDQLDLHPSKQVKQ